MTRLQIFEHAHRQEVNPPLRLKLNQENKRIRVIAVDRYGNWEANIIAFYPSGTMYRHVLRKTFIEKYGLRVDQSDRLWLNHCDGE
jgi:hypothetical protein